MKLKVCEKNRYAINDLLAKANGKACSHTYNNYGNVFSVSLCLEKALEDYGVPKSYRRATTAIVQSGNRTAKAYEYGARTTTLAFYRGGDHWFLTDIKQSELWADSLPEYWVSVSFDVLENADKQRRKLAHIVTRHG